MQDAAAHGGPRNDSELSFVLVDDADEVLRHALVPAAVDIRQAA
jgi:hypothetical protein